MSNLQIIIAWTEPSVELVREHRADLGEAPEMRATTIARAAAWLYDGDEADVEAAKAHVASPESADGSRIYVYPASVKDPKAQARADVLAGKAGR